MITPIIIKKYLITDFISSKDHIVNRNLFMI